MDAAKDFDDKVTNFVKGCRVNFGYTYMTRFYLIRDTLHFNRVNFVTDNASIIKSSIFKIFMKDFVNGRSLYVVKTIDKNLNIEQERQIRKQQQYNLRKMHKRFFN